MLPKEKKQVNHEEQIIKVNSQVGQHKTRSTPDFCQRRHLSVQLTLPLLFKQWEEWMNAVMEEIIIKNVCLPLLYFFLCNCKRNEE